jgi:hypothetical protein
VSVCLNFAEIVYSNSWTGLTAALASTTILTPTDAGFYRVSTTIVPHGSSSNISCEANWNDGYHAQNDIITNTEGSTVVPGQSVAALFVGAGQNLTIETFISEAGTYDLYVAVEKLI